MKYKRLRSQAWFPRRYCVVLRHLSILNLLILLYWPYCILIAKCDTRNNKIITTMFQSLPCVIRTVSWVLWISRLRHQTIRKRTTLKRTVRTRRKPSTHHSTRTLTILVARKRKRKVMSLMYSHIILQCNALYACIQKFRGKKDYLKERISKAGLNIRTYRVIWKQKLS